MSPNKIHKVHTITNKTFYNEKIFNFLQAVEHFLQCTLQFFTHVRMPIPDLKDSRIKSSATDFLRQSTVNIHVVCMYTKYVWYYRWQFNVISDCYVVSICISNCNYVNLCCNCNCKRQDVRRNPKRNMRRNC